MRLHVLRRTVLLVLGSAVASVLVFGVSIAQAAPIAAYQPRQVPESTGTASTLAVGLFILGTALVSFAFAYIALRRPVSATVTMIDSATVEAEPEQMRKAA